MISVVDIWISSIFVLGGALKENKLLYKKEQMCLF